MATQTKTLTDQQKQYFDKQYGGIDKYIDTQQKRYEEAIKTNNADLLQRLEADAARVGYTFDRTQQETPSNTVKTVNTSGLQSAIESNKTPTIYNESQLKTAIDAIGSAGRNNTFDLNTLRQAMEAAKNAGQNPTVRDAKYDSPEAIGNLITQMNQLLQPLTQSQQQAATSGFNQQMEQNRDRWASRGLLASGAAAASEQQGANQLANQLAAIEAANQANAIGHSFNFANLDLAENQQLFNQMANNRDFTAQQAQNFVSNLLSGLNAQQAQNQFDLNRQLALTGTMMDAMGMQHGFNQDFIRNLTNLTDMNIRQNQWSQEFGEGQRQFDTSAFLDMIRMFGGVPSGSTGSIGGNAGYAGGNTGGTLNNLLSQFAGMQTLDARQQDFGNALALSELFGRAVIPNNNLSQLFNQVQGQETFPARRWLQEFAANEQYRDKALKLDWARHNSDVDYKNYLKQQGMTEEQGRKATNGYMIELMKHDDPKSAIQYLLDNVEDIANDGANVNTLLQVFDFMWPDQAQQAQSLAPWQLQGAMNQ